MAVVVFKGVAVLALASVCFAAVGLIPKDETPGHPGHCNSETTGPMEKDAVKQLKDCTEAQCNDDGSISLTSCGAFASSCGRTKGDSSKPYPDCCPQPKKC